MGDQDAMRAATALEVRELGESVNRNFNTLAMTFQRALSQMQTTTPSTNMQPMLGGGQQQQHLEAGSTGIRSPPNYAGHDSQMTAISHQGNIPLPPSSSSTSRNGSRSPSALPIAGVSIPSLGYAPGAWRRALKQWTEADPQTGLALKDWPAAWYTGLMRTTTGSVRSRRQVIFEEYKR
jgi:hypothetical protein